MVKNALKKTYSFKISYIITLLVFVFSMYFYFLAITQTGSIQLFFNETPILILIAQVVFSVLNSVLIGIIMSMVWIIFKEKKAQGNLSFLNALAALFLSVAATGCYVCGTVLIPVFGVAASFAALPLGGLEIKILTIFLLIYSLSDASKNVLGLCAIKKSVTYKIKMGNYYYTFTSLFWTRLKPFIVVVVFVILVFAIPLILPNSLKKEVNASNACVHSSNP
ncbi:hypothetical protein KC669_02065 [Candidatus Dojkabacteria bacterium]|uniref:Uncharacterized protein n=1 Tax=Candidatus Dojkabacteria bacterium TaxID=2099670 RepID=A0A955LA10_9BACT|nr:hypothetical protein [Candidatus Dojkabacteria bacterium]